MLVASLPTSTVCIHCPESFLSGHLLTTTSTALIKGFAAKVSDSMIDTINTLTENYTPLVELDNIVTVSNP